MDMLVPFSEIFLAAVVHATLQMGIGTLLLLYHASTGQHVKKRTRNLVESYLAGVGTLVFMMIATVCFLLACYFGKPLFAEELIIVVALLVALAVAAWSIYYRRGRSTELWLPRTVARFIDARAKETNSNTEAFSLGVLTGLAEMPFSLILTVVAANSALGLPPLQQALAVALYTIITILPLIIMRIVIRKGSTVVDVQRWRVKNRNFLRFMTGALFLVLAIYILAFGVLV